MSTAALDWWQNAIDEAGVQAMEKLLPRNASWDIVLESGRLDFLRAVQFTGMATGPERTIIEVGCGVGRMTATLAQHFGRVIALDIAPLLLQQSKSRNTARNVEFELADGRRIAPKSVSVVDTVFSYEVFYYIDPVVLDTYFRDAYRLLKRGGEFVFELNLEPIRWTTRFSYYLRDVLYRCGVKQFRGWPTGPGFRRHSYDREGVCEQLTQCGFTSISVSGPKRSGTWFVARKPR